MNRTPDANFSAEHPPQPNVKTDHQSLKNRFDSVVIMNNEDLADVDDAQAIRRVNLTEKNQKESLESPSSLWKRDSSHDLLLIGQQ